MSKKIAVIGLKGLPAIGGAASVGENLINQLKNDYDFTILSMSSHANTNEYNGVKQLIFKTYFKGSLNTYIYYIQCLFHCLLNKYDIIHLHHAESGFITPLLRIRSKVVCTFHGVFKENDPKFNRILNNFFRFSERLNVYYANKVISVSSIDQNWINSKYKSKIEYIPNGINLEEKAKAFKTKNKYILFSAGRIYQIKGLHILLESLKSINIKLIVVGDLDQIPEYKLEILKLSQGLDIEFVGMIKEKDKLFDLISNSILFVFPSTTEAMSMMLLEVVSLKTPIIASDIPANTSIFSNNELLFFKSENSKDLSKKIIYALANNEKMNLNAENAYNRLKENYQWKGISVEYKKIYNKILE
jgi:glycosyltransferase involved in cell wall biosynthesis